MAGRVSDVGPLSRERERGRGRGTIRLGSVGTVTIKPQADFFVEKSFRSREVAGFTAVCGIGCGWDATVGRHPPPVLIFPLYMGLNSDSFRMGSGDFLVKRSVTV